MCKHRANLKVLLMLFAPALMLATLKRSERLKPEIKIKSERACSMAAPILKYFTYKHLPEEQQNISRSFCEMATALDGDLPDGPEKSAGLRKLLEAKDCFVRASLP